MVLEERTPDNERVYKVDPEKRKQSITRSCDARFDLSATPSTG
jgi:hypothetical protein